MQELRYVDTTAEKLTKTVSRQKFTASETTHDNEYRIHAVTAEKCWKRVSQQETWRSRRTVCLFFDLGATCTT
jgi:two-component SAPR family response regulator